LLSYASGQTDRQTERQTDILITILSNPTGAKQIGLYLIYYNQIYAVSQKNQDIILLPVTF